MPITCSLCAVTWVASTIRSWVSPAPNCTSELAATLVVQLT